MVKSLLIILFKYNNESSSYCNALRIPSPDYMKVAGFLIKNIREASIMYDGCSTRALFHC